MGNGKDILVWNDSWIPKPHNFQVITRNLFLQHSLRVESLIDQEKRFWNKELLDNMLLKRDMEEIIKIPLSPSPAKDKLIWHFNKNGRFSVRSAYYLGKEFMKRQTKSKRASSSS